MRAVNNFKEQLKEFYEKIKCKNLRITDLFKTIVKANHLEEKFYLCLVNKETFQYYKCDEEDFKSADRDFTESIQGKMQVDAFIKEALNLGEGSITFCNAVTGIVDEKGMVHQVYYWAAIDGVSEINPMYLEALNDAYKEWISEHFIWNVEIQDEKVEKEKLRLRTEETFQRRLKLQFGIDLNVINEIAGTYYESSDCHAVMSFDLTSDPVEYIVELNEAVSLKEANIRLCRKLLQMVPPDHSLLLRRMDKNNELSEWKIVGITKMGAEHRAIRFIIKDKLSSGTIKFL